MLSTTTTAQLPFAVQSVTSASSVISRHRTTMSSSATPKPCWAKLVGVPSSTAKPRAPWNVLPASPITSSRVT
jgi:hypothetical protein